MNGIGKLPRLVHDDDQDEDDQDHAGKESWHSSLQRMMMMMMVMQKWYQLLENYLAKCMIMTRMRKTKTMQEKNPGIARCGIC